MVWVLLAEYSRDEFMRLAEGRGEPVARLLFQDLGIPQECLNPIIRTLTDFARRAMTHALPGTPAVIRLFCQEKLLEAGNPAETTCPKPTVAHPEIIPQAYPRMSGGWGYFLVERSGSMAPKSTVSTYNLVDLYLYKEGE